VSTKSGGQQKTDRNAKATMPFPVNFIEERRSQKKTHIIRKKKGSVTYVFQGVGIFFDGDGVGVPFWAKKVSVKIDGREGSHVDRSFVRRARGRVELSERKTKRNL